MALLEVPGLKIVLSPLTPSRRGSEGWNHCSLLWSWGENRWWKVKESEVAQSCLTLCDPMDCSLPDSSIHGIFKATVLEWVAISFSRGSSWPRDRTQVSRIVGRCFTIWATSKVRLWKGLRLQTIWGLTVTMWVSTSGLNLKPAQFYLWTF